MPCPLLFPYLGLLSGWGCLGGVAACTAAVAAAVHAVAAAKHGLPDGHYVGCQRGGCKVSFVVSRAEAVAAQVGSHYSVPAARGGGRLRSARQTHGRETPGCGPQRKWHSM